MYLTTDQRGPVTIARILWEKVSSREAEILQPEMLAAVAPPIRLVVDLSAVTMLASAGLGLLITLHKRATESGGALVVTGISQEIMGVLTITRLHKLLKIEPSLDEAVKKASP